LEYKYINLIVRLTTRIKELEAELTTFEEDLSKFEDEKLDQQQKIEDLEAKLRVYERPTVALKNLEEEVFRVKPLYDQMKNVVDKEEKEKEIEVIATLRDVPPAVILEVSPTPRSILPPVSPQNKTEKVKKRERSTSPKLDQRVSRRRTSPHQVLDTQSTAESLEVPPIVVNKNKKKRKRKRKEKL